MAGEAETIEVRHLAEESRYEATVDGDVACVLDYRPEADRIAILHTGTSSGFERRGIATRLVEHVLQEAKADGRQVLPYCWFVGDVMKRKPELADLVPADERPKFGL